MKYKIEIKPDREPESPFIDGYSSFEWYSTNEREFYTGNSVGEMEVDEQHDYYAVSAYIHSGIVLTGYEKLSVLQNEDGFPCLSRPDGSTLFDRFDSAYVAYVAVPPETSETEMGLQIEIVNAYLEGRIYGYEVTDEDGNVVDSCWGFYAIGTKDDLVNDIHSCIPGEYKIARSDVEREADSL